MRLFLLTLLCACLAQASAAVANTSHDGWPAINGILVMNKEDGTRPLDARPGHDPFGGKDPDYSCDEVHLRGSCQRRFVSQGGGGARDDRRTRGGGCDSGCVMTSQQGHNELLGGHGSDTIHAGPWGDVLWGDYKPSGQSGSQRDRLYGGPGNDHIYASHGVNTIKAGSGNDWIKAHFGRGTIDCGPGRDTLYLSGSAIKHFKVRGCERISHRTLGY